jgi:hypothetical protein
MRQIELFGDSDFEVIEPMTKNEAIQWQLEVETTGRKLGELLYEGYKRDAWRQLGYGSWTQCVRDLAEKSGFSKPYAFQIFENERLKQDVLLPEVAIATNIPEGQTRPLSKLDTDDEKREVWKRATETAPDGELTAKHVEEAVQQYQQRKAQEDDGPKQIPSPFETAEEFSKRGEGYTEEEWNEKPHSYIGDCFKQCYAPGLMVKGDVWEYGVRGVYVCSGCGYAYPPMMEPDEVDLEEYNRINKDEDEENEEANKDAPKAFNYKRDERSSRPVDIYEPQGYDACQTPAYAIDPLLPYLPDRIIWEPAAGEHYLVEALYDSGFKSEQVITSDILTGQNFFEYTPDEWDCLITNPPYSIKYQWLERCYQLGKPFALLLPVETLGAKTAQEFLKEYGFEMMLLNKRVDFKMPNKGWDSSAQFPVFWLCWQLLPQQVMFGELNKSGR